MESHMRAIVMDSFGSAEVLKLMDITRPAPSDNQVLIEVFATSVNRPDLVQREGNYPPPAGESEILGLEVAGEIIEIGKDVTGLRLGERVAALVGGGGYAEFAVAHPECLIKIPDLMSFEEAACICETYITSYLNLFRIARLETKNTVLLHGGGGGVNTAAVQLCQVLAPEATVVVTASARKAKEVEAMGVNYVVDYQQTSFEKEVARITQSRGVDVILDHVGASYLQSNLRSLAIEGTLLIIGVTSGSRAEINLGTLMVKRQKICGSVLRSRSVAEKGCIINDFRQKVCPFFESRQIIPTISEVFSLDQARDAHLMMEEGRHFGKIVLRVKGS